MKKCFRCGAVKPLEEFYPNAGMKDGRINKCKDCARAESRAFRAAHAEGYAAYERQRFQDASRKAKVKEYARHRNEKHPDKARARYAVNNAIRDGRFHRQPCVVCGDPRAEAHHVDYSRPFEVRWLCFRHHREVEHGQTVHAPDHSVVTRIPQEG